MIRKYDAWICDLCGGEAPAERDHTPMGWRKIPVEISPADEDGAHAPKQEDRHVCPFCIESLLEIEANSKRFSARNQQHKSTMEDVHAAVYPA